MSEQLDQKGNGNFVRDNERVELGQGVWYSRETGYVMLDVTDAVPTLAPLEVGGETLLPKDEYHVSLINIRRFTDTADKEAGIVELVRDYLAETTLDPVDMERADVYLSQYGESVTVLATIEVSESLKRLQTLLASCAPGYEQLLHVTLLRNQPQNRGTAVPSQAFLESNAVKLSEFGVELPLADTSHEAMVYGSERFRLTANNHNEVRFADIDHVIKLVLGKDVALVLPKDSDTLDIHAGYPTHQESWLPMWFVMLNHTQAQSESEMAYLRRIGERVTPADQDRVQKALLYKAKQFWETYQMDTTSEPRKKFKNITRVLQDILLYVDEPVGMIGDQQQYLESHQLYPLVQRANELRNGVGLDMAADFEEAVAAVIDSYTSQFAPDDLHEAYVGLQSDIARRDAGEVFVVPEASITEAELYTQRVACDLVMSDDAHDKDVISIIDGQIVPSFHQMTARTGAGLCDEKRVDIISVPTSIGVWDVVQGGKDSYQPISMIIATHTTPATAEGVALQKRIQSELFPESVARHYLGASHEFLHGHAWGKSYIERIERTDIPQIKKLIPLYRVGCDLLPRAVYMLTTDSFPAGVHNDELFAKTGLKEITEKIEQAFAVQDISDDELRSIYDLLNQKLHLWLGTGDHETFNSNLLRMKRQMGSGE